MVFVYFGNDLEGFAVRNALALKRAQRAKRRIVCFEMSDELDQF